MTIDSHVGRGTTVKLLLPVAGAPRAAAPGGPDAAVASAPRTILLVEDEADVRNTVRRQLETLGHTVLAADTAMDALILAQGPSAPDVLLTDVMLGSGMNGIELAAAVQAVRPPLRVIFMSGYTATSEAQQRLRDTGAPFLAKPFTTPQLERALADALKA